MSFGKGRYADDRLITAAAGGNVRAWRKARRLTQAELALRLGISKRTLEKVERGGLFVRHDVGVRLEPLLTEYKVKRA